MLIGRPCPAPQQLALALQPLPAAMCQLLLAAQDMAKQILLATSKDVI